LRRDLEEVWALHNRSGNGFTEVGSEYLEVMITRA